MSILDALFSESIHYTVTKRIINTSREAEKLTEENHRCFVDLHRIFQPPKRKALKARHVQVRREPERCVRFYTFMSVKK